MLNYVIYMAIVVDIVLYGLWWN